MDLRSRRAGTISIFPLSWERIRYCDELLISGAVMLPLASLIVPRRRMFRWNVPILLILPVPAELAPNSGFLGLVQSREVDKLAS